MAQNARIANYKRPKDTKKTITKLLAYLGGHKWMLLLVVALVLVSSGANIFGTYLLKPVINDYILPGDIPGLIRMLIFMGLMYGAGALATYGYSQLMVHTSQKVVKEIRQDLFAHIQKLPLGYFDAHTHGELMSRFTNDVDTVQEALNNSFSLLIQSAANLVGTMVMLSVLSPQLTLIVMVFLVLMFLLIRSNSRRGKKYFHIQQESLGRINGFVEEMVAGQKVEKVFNHEDADFEEFCRKNEELRQASTKALTYSGMTVPTVVSLSYVNYAVSACAGGLFVIAGLMDLGSLASYLVYVRQSAMPVNQFTMQLNFILSALSGAERIFDMMDEEPEPDDGDVTLCNVTVQPDRSLRESASYTGDFAWKIPTGRAKACGKESPNEVDAKVRETCRNASLRLLRGDVRFDEVVFGYHDDKRILNGISLYAKPGQKIALVGSTGAGKTTIINLINRFYEIQQGTITYDGIDIRRIRKDDLRRSLSMVIQDTHLFTGTIADNIRYGRPEATDQEVEEAARIANADSFIRRLPEGYETMLHSDGANLSQGQRQLLAIARAAISQSPVLILDEATSSIDTRTERLIERGMDALMENRTVFVIAHRLSTVKNAKAIIVLEHGEVMERGSHEELLEKRGRYYQLYTGQAELE